MLYMVRGDLHVERREAVEMYRVVIADDSAAFLEWLKSLLESSPDFEVISEAQDGADALQAVEAYLPDLVLADVEMPEMDGIDIAKITAGQWPNIGVILISSNNEPFYYQAAKESRALAFIAKTELSVAAIQQALREAGRQ
jgi:YesN/AraC family two-component response regulator